MTTLYRQSAGYRKTGSINQFSRWFILIFYWFCAVIPAFAQTNSPAGNLSGDLASTAAITGSTGFWRVLTSVAQPVGTASVSLWSNRTNVNPGSLTITTTGVSAVTGLTRHIEVGTSFEAYQTIRVGQPRQLSFGQQALGYFGDHSPGSPPLPLELVDGSSRVPQLRSPASPTGSLTGAAGYYNLFPFAGLVSSAGAIGSISIDSKIELLTQSAGVPAGLAVHPYFEVPIHKAIDYLMTHPVGTADLQFGVDAIISRKIGSSSLFLNAGYRHIDQPAHATVFSLADVVPLGLAWSIAVDRQFQLVVEATADVFTGSHTPNTSFGAEDPIVLSPGIRVHPIYSLVLSGGYRRTLNQFGGDKNGFVFLLSPSLTRK